MRGCLIVCLVCIALAGVFFGGCVLSVRGSLGGSHGGSHGGNSVAAYGLMLIVVVPVLVAAWIAGSKE